MQTNKLNLCTIIIMWRYTDYIQQFDSVHILAIYLHDASQCGSSKVSSPKAECGNVWMCAALVQFGRPSKE